jgi:hypothetical protein
MRIYPFLQIKNILLWYRMPRRFRIEGAAYSRRFRGVKAINQHLEGMADEYKKPEFAPVEPGTVEERNAFRMHILGLSLFPNLYNRKNLLQSAEQH